MKNNKDFMKKYKDVVINVLILALAIIILTVSFLFDKKLSSFFEDTRNPVVYLLSLFASYSYIIIFLGIAFFLVFSLYTKKREQIPATIFSIVLTVIVTSIFKLLFAKEKPDILASSAFSLLNYSFPATIPGVFASIIPIIIQNKKINYFTYFWICVGIVVSLSSLYIGLYYLSDIICGIIVGYIIGVFVNIVFSKKNWL